MRLIVKPNTPGVLTRHFLEIVAALCVFTGSPVLAAWEITKFKVYEGVPVETLVDHEDASWAQDLDRATSPGWEWREEGEEIPKLSSDQIKGIESFLHDAAIEYSKMGFPDPFPLGGFDSVVTDENGNRAIRVYVYDNPKVPPGRRAGYHSPPPCNPAFARNYMYLNTRSFGKGGGINDQDYLSMAHELFHAAQAATTFFRSFNERPARQGMRNTCERGKWIKEGTADAIAIHLARKLREVDFDENMKPWGQSDALKVLGARRYSEPLNKPSNSDGEYLSSSFWRHLAEESYIGAHGNQKSRHGSWPIPERYLYLVDFFAGEYRSDSSLGGEIDWLNSSMKKHRHIRAGLDKTYSRFVSAFADHVNTRINETKKRLKVMPMSNLQGWLGQTMGGCKDAGSYDTNTSAEIAIKMKPNSAMCVLASPPSGPGLTGGAVEITALHYNKDQLKQMRIGLVDGSLVSAPTIHSVMGDGPPFIARWVFPMFRVGGDSFIVSNMGRRPSRTKDLDVGLYFIQSNWDSSMWQGPLPPPPGPKPTGRPPTKRDIEKQRLEKAISDPVNSLSPVTKVERKSWRRPCELTRSKYNLCNAQMVITLNYAPWTYKENLLSSDFTISNMFLEAGENGPFNINAVGAQFEAGRKTEEFLESVDASKITIALPKTEYGFTGTYNNASIKVSKAGGGSYLSFGPTVYEGQRPINRPPNGSVTIEEYSHQVLRGTFTANLVDPDNRGRDESPIIAHTIFGSFNIPSPYIMDEDFIIDEEHFKQEMIQNMMLNTPFGTGVMDGIIQSQGGAPPQIMCDQGVDEEFLQAMGFTSGCEGRSGGGQVEQACTCDCELREEEEALRKCDRTCRAEWRQCPLPDDMAAGSLDEQMELCKKSMLKKGVPEGQISLFIEKIREVPDSMREQTMKAMCQ